MRDRAKASGGRGFAAHVLRVGVALIAACVTLASAGCMSAANDGSVRADLRAFADTSSTRLNIVADRLANTTESLDEQAALNREKITVANMGIDNAMNANAMTGLLDMAFQFDLKARTAQQRADRLASATRPAQAGSLDRFAKELLAVHAQNRDEVWRATAKRLKPDQLKGLRAMIDEWYSRNGDLDRSSVQIAELQQYAGRDPSRALVFSLVDLKDTNEQVDRLAWGAQRLYENSHWQFRRMLLDAVDELAKPRDESIAAISKAVGEERERPAASATGVVHTFGRWLLTATGVVAAAIVIGALLIWSRERPPPSLADVAMRAELIARIDAIDRKVEASRDVHRSDRSRA